MYFSQFFGRKIVCRRENGSMKMSMLARERDCVREVERKYGEFERD